MKNSNKVSTSLVLGSGGARGLAHIGVIRRLEEKGYVVGDVAGSSIGALIGGIYAAGKLDVYVDWVTRLQRTDVLLLLDPSLAGDSLLKGIRIINVLRELIGDYQIEDLPIGFTAVATDLANAGSGREVWLNRGSMFEAIRASIAVPSLFAPVHKDGRLLVDGSVLNPLPVGPTLHRPTRVTVAVNLNGRYDTTRKLPVSVARPPEPEGDSDSVTSYTDRFGQFLGKVWPVSTESPVIRLGLTEVALRSMEAMQASITDFRLAANMPSIVVNIPSNLCSFFDFHRAQELIEFGYERAGKAIDEFEANEPGLNRPGLIADSSPD